MYECARFKWRRQDLNPELSDSAVTIFLPNTDKEASSFCEEFRLSSSSAS